MSAYSWRRIGNGSSRGCLDCSGVGWEGEVEVWQGRRRARGGRRGQRGGGKRGRSLCLVLKCELNDQLISAPFHFCLLKHVPGNQHLIKLGMLEEEEEEEEGGGVAGWTGSFRAVRNDVWRTAFVGIILNELLSYTQMNLWFFVIVFFVCVANCHFEFCSEIPPWWMAT